MPHFDWRQTLGRPLVNRFADSAVGWREWRRLVEDLEQLNPAGSTDAALAILDQFLEGTASLSTRKPKRDCRVFVSHRAMPSDTAFAERIAWLAVQKGYEYWLDVHDATLNLVNGKGKAIPSPARDVLIAAIIEMGLLNASHVIAVMTGHSAGSKWIPYEFGRAKQRMLFSRCSAVWLDRGMNVADCGEYVHLGVINKTEVDIDDWLDRPGDDICKRSPSTWPNPSEPPPLPL